MRTKETALTQTGRVEATQRAGTRLARLFYFYFFIKRYDIGDNLYFNKKNIVNNSYCVIVRLREDLKRTTVVTEV